MLYDYQFHGIWLSEWLEFYKQNQLRKGRHDFKIISFTTKLVKWYHDIELAQLSLPYCLGFIDYLQNIYKTRQNKPLAKVTARNYYRCMNTALNTAVRCDVIPSNPCKKIHHTDKIKVPETTRQYLTIDEIRKLIVTPCKREDIKSAYLFSCFCGLRISDVMTLKWEEIVNDGNMKCISKVMHKTGVSIYLPLSQEAMRWFPKPQKGSIYVFHLPSSNYINKILVSWSKAAGLKKHITFHTARHTFATMMLTLGADLYTTSKLLGHTNIATTQIYARIINKKKEEAVNLVNGLF